jgi:hypothetical protein
VRRKWCALGRVERRRVVLEKGSWLTLVVFCIVFSILLLLQCRWKHSMGMLLPLIVDCSWSARGGSD